MLKHVSINAKDPESVARFLAEIMGGMAMPFPPFADSWIAFTKDDDGTAIEIYPLEHRLHMGEVAVEAKPGVPDTHQTFVHVAIGSVLAEPKIVHAAKSRNWPARKCNRGPFECIEVWVEGRLLVEILDEQMQKDYQAGMRADNWRAMFGL